MKQANFPVSGWLREDGTGYFHDCPKCHFYKNVAVGPCRNTGCDGIVVQVEFRVTPPDPETWREAHPNTMIGRRHG